MQQHTKWASDPAATPTAVGVFMDVENVTGLDEEDLREVLDEVSQYGPLVVRRAYGRWSDPSLHHMQRPLTALGFELVHAWHPVAGKGSADILMVVDVMHIAMRMPDIRTFVLVTSDSDFSPLFRRLREMGRMVIGVGRRSPLADMVMNSCSRFLFLGPAPERPSISRREEAVAKVLRILEQMGGTSDLGGLKSRLLNVAPGFDERALGFSDFRSFLRSIPEVSVWEHQGVWLARLVDEPQGSTGESVSGSPYWKAAPTTAVYEGLLRKKGWRTVEPDVLQAVVQELPHLGTATAAELRNALVDRLCDRHLPSEIRKAWSILFRSFLMEHVGCTEDGTTLWRWPPDRTWEDTVDAVDLAMLKRLSAAREEYQVAWASGAVRPLLLGSDDEDRLARLAARAERELAQSGTGPGPHPSSCHEPATTCPR